MLTRCCVTHRLGTSFHVERSLDALKALPSSQRAECKYDSLISDPIGTVESIYAAFGMRVSDEFRANMQQFIKDFPQHRRGPTKVSDMCV